MADGVNFGSSSLPTVSVDLKMDDLDRRSVLLADEARKISRLTVSAVVTNMTECALFRKLPFP